jgi:hypothetical protein
MHRALVDKDDLELKAIVVEEGRLFSGLFLAPGSALITPDVVVPITAVANTSEDRVDLSLSAAEIRHLPPYLHYRRLPPTFSDQAMVLGASMGGNTPIPRLEETADKPTGEIEIDPGENVMLGHSGRKLGHVHEVLFDDDQLVGIVMHPEGWFKGPVIVPRRFLERSDDEALFVHLTEDGLKQLEPFVPPE